MLICSKYSLVGLMAGKLYNIIQKQTFLLILLVVITLLITAQSYMLPPGKNINGYEYKQYNNYKIFQRAWFHLIENKDLYRLYPAEQFDYYKYSPSFAMLMAPIAYLPDAIGLLFWNLLNALVFFFAFIKFPFQNHKIRLLAFGFVLIELILSLQNEQSNALITGLIIMAFLSLEENRSGPASLFIVLSVFIKLFGAAAFVLYLFYPNKIKLVLYTLGWFVLLTILPLLVISPHQLIYLYKSWVSLLIHDESVSYGLSVDGWLHSWFHLVTSKSLVLMIGIFLFSIPLFKIRNYKDQMFRILFLSSILIWVVIFNYKAESPTYVIAVSGVAFWYFMQDRKIENLVLLVLVFLFTVLSPTDLFPQNIRTIFADYAVKAIPCIIIWLKLIYDLIVFRPAVISPEVSFD